MLKSLFLLLFFASTSFGWNDERTHPTISEFSAEQFFGANFMSEYLDGVQVKTLIRDGSMLEDTGSLAQFISGTARSLNHFHNASKGTLGEAGLTDLPSYIPFSGTPTSALLWAQDSDNQRAKVIGDWSWSMVRDIYFKSLTTSDKKLRELWQGDYLKGLGHQMHMIQDMGQPNHVRNDTHVWDGASLMMGLETWAKINDVEIIRNKILKVENIPVVTVNLKTEFIENPAKTPVANLFDTRGYKGTRPPTAAFDQGLAEYTNSNFFSESTIFASEYPANDKHYQPYPRKSETNVQDYIDYLMPLTIINSEEEFGPFKSFTVSKQSTSGEKLNCLATVGPFSRKIFQENGEGKYFYRSFSYDSCFQEYAEKLIPASAAYSIAMLGYFHRGTIESQPVPGASTFRTIKVTAQNTTPNNEQMPGGEVALVLRYRNFTEDDTTTPITLRPPAPDAEYQYKVVKMPNTPILRDTQVELTFDLSSDPLPFWASDTEMQLVYRGTLGEEKDIAVGVSAWTKLNGINPDITVSLPTAGVYSSIQANAESFNNLAVKAATPGELTLPDGVMQLVIEFRKATSDPYEAPPLATLPEEQTASYLIRAPLSQAGSGDLTFDLSASPLPLWATDVKLYLVYKHADDPASRVYAYGALDISEPTPIDVFNNADKICINNQWHDAGSVAAIALSDSNGDGIPDRFDPYAHNIANIYNKASSSTAASSASSNNFTFHSPTMLTSGSFRRLGYILTDYSFKYSVKEDWLNTDPSDPWEYVEPAEMFTGTAFRYQADSSGSYIWPGMYSIRGGEPMWWGAGLIYDNNSYPFGKPADDACGWDNL